MRAFIFWLSLSVFIVLMLALSAGLALAELAPFHPGEPLFSVQLNAEQALAVLAPNPEARAQFRLDLLERRAADLERPGIDPETVDRLGRAIDQALSALANDPDKTNSELRSRSLTILARAYDRLTRLAGNREDLAGPAGLVRGRIETAMQVLADLGQPLSALVNGETENTVAIRAADSNSALSETSTPIPQSIDPHGVAFQNSSGGAEHAFFPLTGKHAVIECSACHTSVQYAGTPNTCQSCHASQIPTHHYPGECTLCHTTAAWKPVQFDHNLAKATDCLTCHLANKPTNHWNGQCALCHTTKAWKPATFNHAAVGATDCQSCHSAKKPANHFAGQCSACHTTKAWKPATFNHAAVRATDCQSCHSASKPANHFAGQCSACHTTQVWKPATFNHAAVGATDCQSCHSVKKPANHFAGQCSACHATTAWKPATFNHAAVGATDCQSCHSAKKPANHYAGQCSACHTTTAWKPATFNHSFPLNHGGANGRCAACHVNGTGPVNCFNCHNKAELDQKHITERKITDYASRCIQCHPAGKGN